MTLPTNGDGIYSAPLLQVGDDSLRATVMGFEPKVVDQIELEVSDSLRASLALDPGQQKEAIEVTNVNNTALGTSTDAAAETLSGRLSGSFCRTGLPDSAHITVLSPNGIHFGNHRWPPLG